MMLRCLIVCLPLVVLLSAPLSVRAATFKTAGRQVAAAVQYRSAQRAAIRQLPLLMRPGRPGHFYGNTVRRIYRLRTR